MPNERAGATEPQSILSESQLVEAGKRVTLELIVYRPEGNGPFPVVIFNHGSTGSGDRPELFGRSMVNTGIADYFNRRGYMVVFPQRRGRGRSGGLYDEGFTADRSRYSCALASVDPGVERAVLDIRAAIAIVRTWPDAAAAPILLVGHSRGGILSLLVAAAEPAGISGVINFSGGWLGQACATYRKVNRQLFARASGWTGPSLFLYSDNDPFYPIRENLKNHAVFIAGGGIATFVKPSLPAQSNGHFLIDQPGAWAESVSQFLNSSGQPERM